MHRVSHFSVSLLLFSPLSALWLQVDSTFLKAVLSAELGKAPAQHTPLPSQLVHLFA